MFIDKATIKVQAGSGGNGAVSFHRESLSQQADRTAATADAVATSCCRAAKASTH